MFFSRLRTTYFGIAILAAAYLVVIAFTRNTYYQLMLTLVPIWAILGLSWNVLSGYSGLVSFGHAAFFGLGAFAAVLLFSLGGVTPWIGIVVAGLVGALAGLLIGAITFRLRGHYFALAMLAYPLAMLYVFEWAGFFEVTMPMKRENAAAYMQFADQRWLAVVVLVLMIGAMLISIRIERSRFGLSLLSIKQNEIAAEASGIDSLRWKLKAIAISGAMAGIAGGLYAAAILVVTPQSVFGMPVSAQALILSMFGGVGTVWGPVIGAVVLVPLAEILHGELGARFPGIQGVVFGIAVILVIIRMPQGVYWALRDRFHRPRPTVASTAEAPVDATAIITPAAKSDAPLLQVAEVSRAFGGVRALADVTLNVKPNEILGIIGPNGAGKTTLFNVLNGLIAPDKGRIVFAGTSLGGLKPNKVCRLGIGRTFQVARPFPRMSLVENVVVGAFVHTDNDADARLRARTVLARLGLAAKADAPAGELTNYELRLMELARALASKPTLLLLDEPFAGLASTEIVAFMAVIRSLRADGLTVVIIEHTMQAMVKLVDRFVVLDHGVVIAEGAPRDVVRNPEVIKAYLGENWGRDAVA